MKFSYYHLRGLRGTLGDQQILEMPNVQAAIKKIFHHDYTDKNLEKLTHHDIYSFRINDAERLLFTTVHIPKDGPEYLLILDYLPTHQYDRSQFLRSGQLRNYRERYESLTPEQLEQLSCELEQLSFKPVFKPVDDTAEFSKRMRHVTPLDETINPVLDYDNTGKLIQLSEIQNEDLTLKLPAVISGGAGSGKTSIAIAALSQYAENYTENYIENHTENQMNATASALYITKSHQLCQSVQKHWQTLPISRDQAANSVEFSTSVK